jgi:hypothetical protein
MAATTTTTTARTRTATPTTAPTNRPGALAIPGSASELHELVNVQRALHNGLHGSVADIAAFLKHNLPDVIAARGGTRRGFGGLDATLMARRVARPLQNISKLEEEISKLWVVTWVSYEENVNNVRTNTGRGAFNADA